MSTPIHPSLVTPPKQSFATAIAVPALAAATAGYVANANDLSTAFTIAFGALAAIAAMAFFRCRSYGRCIHAQAALLAANERTFLQALDHATHGVAHISAEGKWLHANVAVARITGYTPEELLKLDFQTITHPDDLDADLLQVKQILSRKIETYSMEKRYIRKDGGIIWVLLTVSAVWDATGQLRYFISEIQDINERKLLQEKLRASEARLRHV